MNTSKIISVIKIELKKNKITYEQIADRLGMSEAGIKKLLNKEDISLKKMESICEVLNLSLIELLKIAENENVGTIMFTEKQITFFLSKPHFFHFFMKLAYERKSPNEIQQEFNLSPKSISLYLKKLEEIELIRRHPHNRNQIIGGIPLEINTKGTKLDVLKQRIATKLLNGLQDTQSSQLKGAGLFLSKEQSETFRDRIETILLDYSAMSRSNRKKTSKSDFSDLTFMSFVNYSSMFNEVIEL